MAISRGYSFATDEVVTNTSLHKLVDDATISAIAPGDLTGSVRGIHSATPSSFADGTFMFLQETSVSLAEPSALARWNHPMYLVAQHETFVALFGADRLESGRFVLGTDFASTLDTGDPALSEISPPNGAAPILYLGQDTTAPPKFHTLGSTQRPTAPDAFARITMLGYGPSRHDVGSHNTDFFGSLFHGTNAVWQGSGASHTSGFFAYRLNTVALTGNPFRLAPSYMLGGPCFRG